MPNKVNAKDDPFKNYVLSDPAYPGRGDVLNYKPVLQKFVEANEAFLDCMASFPKDEVASMSPAQLDSSCQREKIAIKSILESNQMTMT